MIEIFIIYILYVSFSKSAQYSISGLVVKFLLAMQEPRVGFPADAISFSNKKPTRHPFHTHSFRHANFIVEVIVMC